MYRGLGRTHGIDLLELVRRFYNHLTTVVGWTHEEVAPVLARDYAAGGRRIVPKFLR